MVKSCLATIAEVAEPDTSITDVVYGAIGARLPQHHTVLSAFPNPFNSAVAIGISGADVGALDIFDIAGRKVVTMPVPDGQSRVRWDGRDHRGNPAASGVYFVKPSGLADREALKILYLK